MEKLWRPGVGPGAFLSALAVEGIDHKASKVGKPIVRIALTEDCEIIECTDSAEKSLREAPNSHE